MTPGQRGSARQQYRYDVVVQAAQDALKALKGKRGWAHQRENLRQPERAKSILRSALREIGELYD